MFKSLYHVVENVGKNIGSGRELNPYSFLAGVIWLTKQSVEDINEHFQDENDKEDILQCWRLTLMNMP